MARTVYGRRNLGRRRESQDWYDPKDYPLVSEVLTKLVPNPSVASDAPIVERSLVRFTTPEIMQGVEVFLNSHDRRVEPIIDSSKPSLPRRAAEKFSFTSNKLELVAASVAETLEDAHSALPEDGQSFADGVIRLSQKIVELADLGLSGKQIADTLRKDIWPKRTLRF